MRQNEGEPDSIHYPMALTKIIKTEIRLPSRLTDPITSRNPADLQQHSKRLSLYLICLDYPDFADLGIRVLRVHVRGQVSP